ncbi:MAG: hypothetical protein NTV70_22740 [Acidobacteria bacterium]|nr:hypothetical protein [Acidobacteriota bacterium]
MPVSKLIRDLSSVPNVVADLGLAIAQAQKQLNIDYIDSLKVLAAIAKDALGSSKEADSDAFLKHLVMTAAPARYQFTETTLMVRMDLSESKQSQITAGGGFGMAGVVVNGSFSAGRSSEYRAGAEVRTVIHAVLPQDNQTAFNSLLDRAKNLAIDTTKELPSTLQLDKDLFESAQAARKLAMETLPEKP